MKRITSVTTSIAFIALLTSCDIPNLGNAGNESDSTPQPQDLEPETNERVEVCNAKTDATCYYVSPDASGAGTYTDPGSLHEVLPKLSKGDYVYLFEGVYTQYQTDYNPNYIISINKYFSFTEPLPTKDQPVTISGYPDETVIIRGDKEQACIFVDGSSHIVFQNLIVEDCFNEGMRLGWDVPGTGITLANMEFRNIEYFDNSGFLYVQGYDDVEIKNSYFHDYVPKANNQVGSYLKFYLASNISIHDSLFDGDGGGIYYKHGESTTTAGGFTKIYNNEFINLSKHGIYTNQNRTEIFNNLFHNSDGVLVHQEDGTRPPFTQNVEVRNNTFVNSQLVLNRGSNDGSYMGATGLGAKYATVTSNAFKDSQYRIWVYGSNQQYDEGIDLQSDSNCFIGVENSNVIRYFSADSFGDKGQEYFLDGWKAFGYDNSSEEVNLALNTNQELESTVSCIDSGWNKPQ